MYRADVLQADGTFKREQCWQPLALVSEQSERAAWRHLQPYLDKVNDAAKKLPTRTGLTLAEFVAEWRRDVAVNLKGSTVKATESHLRAHIVPKLGSLHLTEIATKAVQGFVAYEQVAREAIASAPRQAWNRARRIPFAEAWRGKCSTRRRRNSGCLYNGN